MREKKKRKIDQTNNSPHECGGIFIPLHIAIKNNTVYHCPVSSIATSNTSWLQEGGIYALDIQSSRGYCFVFIVIFFGGAKVPTFCILDFATALLRTGMGFSTRNLSLLSATLRFMWGSWCVECSRSRKRERKKSRQLEKSAVFASGTLNPQTVEEVLRESLGATVSVGQKG